MTNKAQIVNLRADETFELRHRILKPNLRPNEVDLPGDQLPTTFHLGVDYLGHIVTTATFMMQSHPEINAGFPYRLRGMATEKKYWGQNFGSLVLQAGVQRLKEIRCDLLWFNARVNAFGFYEKQGFVCMGPLFDLPDIGAHKVMYKHLFPR